MTQLRLIELAQDVALTRWGKAHDQLEEMPTNKIRQELERQRWEELIELEAMERQAREIEAGDADV